jgi:ABC-2 type transport system ATP-binding protein
VLRDLLAARVTGDVPGLTVTRPSLEDVYLDLVGAPSTRSTETEGDL